MATFNKQKIGTANAFTSKLDVSGTHITTGNFMSFQPVFYRHMLPGEHLRGSLSALTRLAPVAVPTYGRCRLNLRSFFVPFSFVYPNFNEMITDVVANNFENSSLVADSPSITTENIQLMFLTYKFIGVYDLVQDVSNSVAPYDFRVGSSKYKFTKYGRRFYKILQSLGYQLVVVASKEKFKLSALPLLCAAKVYIDWYTNMAYQDNAVYLQLKRWFKFNDPHQSFELTAGQLGNLLEAISFVCYDNGNDVYTNAWDTPNSPTAGNYTPISALDERFSDITDDNGSYVMSNSDGTPVMVSDQAHILGTQYIHNMLRALTDYFKRNQLSGSVAVNRFLAQYGINLDSKAIARSYYLGSQSIDINFGSVVQTADTSPNNAPSNLGDYSGIGFGRGDLDIDFKSDEFGLFLVVATIVPASEIVQGIDANLFHINKYDFYNAAFDNLGCAAIRKAEVYCSRDSNFVNAGTDYIKTFGFAPRYYEYKQGRSMVSGDFNTAVMVGGNAWHLFRLFNDNSFLGGINGLGHSLTFTSGGDASQYDRIFQYTDDDIDKFYLVFHAALQATAPCKSLFDTYDFENVGKVVEMNGNSSPAN